jgi:hypothetical protein
VQTLIFSQGARRGRGRQLSEEGVQGFVEVDDLGGKAGGLDGEIAGDDAEPDLVLLRG